MHQFRPTHKSSGYMGLSIWMNDGGRDVSSELTVHTVHQPVSGLDIIVSKSEESHTYLLATSQNSSLADSVDDHDKCFNGGRSSFSNCRNGATRTALSMVATLPWLD